MKNSTYDVLKFWALIMLPAIATLYGALAGIWGLPRGMEVVSTITAIDVFLGTLLGVSTANHNKNKPTAPGEPETFDGTFKVNTTEDGSAYQLILDRAPEDLETLPHFALKVEHN